MTVLEEMTAVMLTVPGLRTSDHEVAAWYERKARLFEHIAAKGGPDAEDAHRQAELAHQHAVRLVQAVA